MRALLALALVACQTAPPAAEVAAEAAEAVEAEVRAAIDELYAAFGFDAGAEPDWATQRARYLEGAVFIAPAREGAPAVAEDTETFLAGFATYVREGPYRETGLHERLLAVRVELFGGIAHAWVAFEGHAPGEDEARTRGLDSLQLVRDAGVWRLASFTTQYEGEGLELPARLR